MPEVRKTMLRGLLPKARRMYKNWLRNASDRGLGAIWTIVQKLENPDPSAEELTKVVHMEWPYLFLAPVEDQDSARCSISSSSFQLHGDLPQRAPIRNVNTNRLTHVEMVAIHLVPGLSQRPEQTTTTRRTLTERVSLTSIGIEYRHASC